MLHKNCDIKSKLNSNSLHARLFFMLFCLLQISLLESTLYTTSLGNSLNSEHGDIITALNALEIKSLYSVNTKNVYLQYQPVLNPSYTNDP